MSGESLSIGDRARMPRWLARLAGMTAITAALVAPACSSNAESIAVQPDTGVTLDIPEPSPIVNTEPQPEVLVQRRSITRDTGMDRDPCWRFAVCGTDLLVPFKMPNGSYAYMTGDTFVTKGPYEDPLPPGGDKWRSPAMLFASQVPQEHVPIHFDRAFGLEGEGVTPGFIYNSHRRNGREVTVFPNDGVSLPDGRIIVSYQSVGGPNGEISPENANWSTNYSGLAVSHDDGRSFKRLLSGRDGHPGAGDPVWMNNEQNSDPNQMWSMQIDGDYVYIVSVRAGRTKGPMIMLRVPWREIENKGSYQCWNGTDWGGECAPILPDRKYGEPSIRKIDDGTPEGLWVMSYVDYTFTQLETRTAKSPTGPWSEPKMQMHWHELNALYGGFIHPASTPDNLILMVSTWQREIDEDKYGKFGKLLRYDVSHFNTTTY
jgi:hypothetical protein